MTLHHTIAGTPPTDRNQPAPESYTSPAPGGSVRLTPRHWGGPVVGGFYLTMGGVHIGMVAADTEVYRHFADAGLFSFFRDGWQDIFMAQPAVFGLLIAAGEITLGILLLMAGRAATVGWVGVVAFHVLLMLFGFGIWVWCLPALAVLAYLTRRDNGRRPLHLRRRPA
jgi:hypothetical protein